MNTKESGGGGGGGGGEGGGGGGVSRCGYYQFSNSSSYRLELS